MSRNHRTLTIYRLDDPENENPEQASEKGYTHSYSEYDREGNLLLDIDYNDFEEVEQKTINVFKNKLPIETRVFQGEDDPTEWKTYEYSDNGMLTAEKLHYLDGSVDITEVKYNGNGIPVSKSTVNSDGETDSRVVWDYNNDKLLSEKVFDENNKVVHQVTNTYNEEGYLSESLIEEFDDNRRTWRKYFFDDKGNRIKSLRYNHKDQLIEINRYFYEGDRLVKIEDEDQYRNNIILMEHDDKGNVILQTETDKSGEVVSTIKRKYDEDGRVLFSRVYMAGMGLRPDQDYLLSYVYEFYD